MASQLNSPSALVRARMQAALYYARKRNVERREEVEPEPEPDPEESED